jgi:hypothetical protein
MLKIKLVKFNMVQIYLTKLFIRIIQQQSLRILDKKFKNLKKMY